MKKYFILSFFSFILIFSNISCKDKKDNKVKLEENKNLTKEIIEKENIKREIITPKNMVKINGGYFYFGDIYNSGDIDEIPVSKITLKDFFIGKYEVTFDEYDLFCEDTNREKPDDNGFNRGKNPVINVSWIDAISYCNYLSKKENKEECYNLKDLSCDFNKIGYRLLTEAEFEIVSSNHFKFNKQKKKSIYPWGNKEPDKNIANFNDYIGKIVEVGSYKGYNDIFDLSGNVYEWVHDFYSEYNDQSKENPIGPNKGKYKVIRGGSFLSGAFSIRATKRANEKLDEKSVDIGFRLAMTAE
jgi:formylglycine-generating enzyme required for sulfatase activity